MNTRLHLSLIIFLLGAVQAKSEVNPTPLPSKLQVFVDEGKVPQTGPTIVIPYNAWQVRFIIIPVPGIVRYRLVGYDHWQQRNGQMFVGVRFFKQNGDFLESMTFLANGQSSGWRGDLENSAFTSREEVISSSPEPRLAELFITSAGPPASVGLLAVTDFHLTANNTPLNPQPKWRKEGTRPSMAFERKIAGDDSLVIDDIDIKAHADWVSSRITIPAGEAMVLKWKELFSNGIGDPMTAFYGRLPSGSYRFEIEEVGLSGNQPKKYSFGVEVPPPFWRTWWFWALCFLGTVVAGVSGGLFWGRTQIRLREEKQRLIEEERRRIARDWHDDLGARISQISLASSQAEEFTDADQTRERLRTITGLAQELGFSLSEAVWMLNSKNDHLESLVEFLCQLVTSLCNFSNVRCRVQADTLRRHVPLNSEFRRHVTLAVREAITNVLRHSGASEVCFTAKIDASHLILHITDNGQGISRDASRGNGLANMEERITTLQGRFAIETPPPGGTRVIFEIPLPLKPNHEN